jgi:hypothetical protein
LQALQQARGLLVLCCSERFAVAQLIEAQRYKPEGQGIDSFRTNYGPGVNSEMSTRNIPWRVKAAGE